MTIPPFKHGQGRDDQDEKADLAILGCLVILTAFIITVAGSFALGYWFAGVKFL